MAFGRRRSPSPSSNSHEESTRPAEEQVKSKKPANTAFRQQRLRAWQPVLTPRTIILVWSILSVILLAAGGVLFWLSTTVRDLSIEYTKCRNEAPTDDKGDVMPSGYVTAHFADSDSQLNPNIAKWRRTNQTSPYGSNDTLSHCIIEFNVPEDLEPPIVMYYKLSNFYQNHRRYVTSFDLSQLSGDAIMNLNSSSCSQLHSDPEGSGKPIYPCGLIANSIFNDTFTQPALLNGNTSAAETYVMSQTNIAWSTESDLYGETKYKPSDVVPPPNWKMRFPNGYNETNIKRVTLDPHFQVWMRTAATALFSKPWQRSDSSSGTMRKGTYRIDIEDNFPVTAFNGKKFIVFSTLSALGGRNPWVGIIFLVTGGFCLIMTVVFSIGHLLRPRKMGDHTYLSWNNAPAAQAATATGADTSAAGRGGVRQR